MQQERDDRDVHLSSVNEEMPAEIERIQREGEAKANEEQERIELELARIKEAGEVRLQREEESSSAGPSLSRRRSHRPPDHLAEYLQLLSVCANL